MRFPRILTALVATGTTVTVLGLSAAPVSADQVRSQEWWLSSLGVSGIWPASQGSGVKVAVLSDGVVLSHPDLTGAVTTAPAIHGAPVAAGQFFGEQGTPIASLIAGRGHGSGGSSGVIGVAPRAQILSVPVTLPSNDPQLGQAAVATAIPAAIASGIRYAVGQGAGVIDLPIDPSQPGSSGQAGASLAMGASPAVRRAINYALSHNVVVVAPAGDDGQSTNAANYPAAYPGVIAVGAFDATFTKAPWTIRRAYVTVTGPGSGVVAATPAGGYQTMNSTAAASAVVAGIVALIRSRYPALTVTDIRNALIKTTSFTRPGGSTDGSGYGAVNAARAFTLAAVLATPPKDRAGAGAQPAVTPGPASAGVGAQSLRSQVVRAGEISGALLVLLLLLVTCYAIARRRRRKSSSSLPAALAAQWTAGHAQSRYPHAPVTDADRMLELFAVPLAAPPPTAGGLDVTSRPGRAAVSGSGAQARRDLFATGPRSGEPDFDAGPPRSLPPTRRPPVTGTPPWEPAPQPAGELPWDDEPLQQTVAGEVVSSGFPADGTVDSWAGTAASAPVEWPRPPGLDEQPSDDGRPSWDDRPRVTPPAAFVRGRPQPGASGRQAGPAAANGSWEESVARAQPAASADTGDADWAGADSAAAGQHPSGLPIRQPRAASTSPLSPSGSLWERPQSGSSLWDKAAATPEDDWDETTDTAGRPIYTWDPARTER